MAVNTPSLFSTRKGVNIVADKMEPEVLELIARIKAWAKSEPDLEEANLVDIVNALLDRAIGGNQKTVN